MTSTHARVMQHALSTIPVPADSTPPSSEKICPEWRSNQEKVYEQVAIIKYPDRMNILEIRASARKSRSLTRMLADTFAETLKEKGAQPEVKIRDVGLLPPSIISEAWISAAFSKEPLDEAHHMALRESDRYIDELRWADLIVMATPMYNYGMPASLKAWFDQVIRINKTFTFDLSRGDFPLEPAIKDKALVLFTSSGEFGFEDGGIRAGHDHLVPHIKTCAKYLGVDVENDFYHLGIEYQEFGDSRHEYDPANDFMYVFAKLDANQNGQGDDAEDIHIFWIDLANPENTGRQY